MTSQEVNPAGYAILGEDPELRSTKADALVNESPADILGYTGNRVTIQAKIPSDGFLVLSDLYHAGWRALFDGEEEKVYRAD